jgi:hypothetical protein
MYPFNMRTASLFLAALVAVAHAAPLSVAYGGAGSHSADGSVRTFGSAGSYKSPDGSTSRSFAHYGSSSSSKPDRRTVSGGAGAFSTDSDGNTHTSDISFDSEPGSEVTNSASSSSDGSDPSVSTTIVPDPAAAPEMPTSSRTGNSRGPAIRWCMSNIDACVAASMAQ